jgi:hypothetical protein
MNTLGPVHKAGVRGDNLNTDVNTLRTGDENPRLWRFFFTTVKDR